jgi:hypothetical protein
MATATETKPKTREVTYFEMTGGADGPKIRLTKPSVKALSDAANVLHALSKAGFVFPGAEHIALDLERFLADPQKQVEKRVNI